MEAHLLSDPSQLQEGNPDSRLPEAMSTLENPTVVMAVLAEVLVELQPAVPITLGQEDPMAQTVRQDQPTEHLELDREPQPEPMESLEALFTPEAEAVGLAEVQEVEVVTAVKAEAVMRETILPPHLLLMTTKEKTEQPIPEAVEADAQEPVDKTILAAQADPASYWSGGAINTNQCGSHYRDK